MKVYFLKNDIDININIYKISNSIKQYKINLAPDFLKKAMINKNKYLVRDYRVKKYRKQYNLSVPITTILRPFGSRQWYTNEMKIRDRINFYKKKCTSK